MGLYYSPMDYEVAKSIPSFVDRLQSCIDQAGSLYAFLKRTGMAKGTIKGYLKGAEPGRVRLASLAEKLGVTPEWLAYGVGEKDAPAKHGWVPISELQWHRDKDSGKIRMTQGPATLMVRVETVDRSFLGTPADQLLTFRMPDTSLSPILLKDEWVILDRSKRLPQHGGVFCVAIEGTVTIRNVGLAGPGRVRISTQNERTYSALEYPLNEIGSTFDLLGEVIIASIWLNPSRLHFNGKP